MTDTVAPRAAAAARLSQLGAIMVTGAQARAYLQGQLTADLDTLNPAQVQLACCNSAQGRVQAVFWVLERGAGIALILPANLIENTVARLRKYVLRAKVSIEAAPDLHVGFIARSALPAEVTLPDARSHQELAGVSYFNLPGVDAVMVLGMTAETDEESEYRWQLARIRAGLPQVFPETHESFVAQMLNIDLLEGISFEKGCYTGQEIIARAHFRGAVKRRMFRFSSAAPAPAPGTRVLAGEQHAGEVVDSVATRSGCELLAVISLAQLTNELRVDGQSTALTRLELPYSVPAG
jgi:folate-binding protein YgfZ